MALASRRTEAEAASLLRAGPRTATVLLRLLSISRSRSQASLAPRGGEILLMGGLACVGGNGETCRHLWRQSTTATQAAWICTQKSPWTCCHREFLSVSSIEKSCLKGITHKKQWPSVRQSSVPPGPQFPHLENNADYQRLEHRADLICYRIIYTRSC